MADNRDPSLTRQARAGVRRVPWRTVVAGAGGASLLTLLAVSGCGPLIGAVAAGALSLTEVQAWLASLGANALSGWVADWATGATAEALADPAERERRAAELERRATADPATAAALAQLLAEIDAVPQSLEALAEELGAQSDLLLAQHALLARLGADVQRLGLDAGALGPALIQEADRVIATVTAHGDAQTGAILAELRALRDAQRAAVDLRGAQTGPVTFAGDVAGGDIHKPTIAPGGVYAAPGSSVTVLPSLAQRLHQLRAPVGDFVGRATEIEQLLQALRAGAAAAICGVRGMGGIGKTELAYVVADQLRADYPDAQLLVELRGATPAPLGPEQALQTLIRAFEPEAQLPDDLGQLQGIYRSALAGRRVLILADDAHDAAQVRPLLPPPGCALLVTSRRRFTLPKMVPIDLGALLPGEAEALLLDICPRIGAHAGALARLCGSLPLALRVSASLLAASDTRPVARYLEQLAAARLALLSDPDDPTASVEASLRLSYEALTPAAQATLCQLSVFPASFDLAAAEAVVAVEGTVADLLDLLRRRCLLEWDAGGERFDQHDLVRVFGAARLAEAEAVRLRHARHYEAVAWRAGGELYDQGGAAMLAGLALFDRERSQIDAGWAWARGNAGSAEADTLVYRFANTLADIGPLRYHARRERIPQLDAALAAARRLGDRRGEGNTLGNLGIAYYALGDTRQATSFYEQHLTLAREIGDRRGEGNALGNLGIAYYDMGDARQAISFYGQHLTLAREIGDRRGEGNALGNLGLAHAALGDARQATAYHEQALVVSREIGDRWGEAFTSWNLGLALARAGRPEAALALLETCVAYEREIGHPDAEANAATVDYVRQHGRLPGDQQAAGDSGTAPD